MALLEDEDTQIKGIVDVLYSRGTADSQPNLSDFLTLGAFMLINLPVRISALHFCFGDPRLRAFMSWIQMVAGKQPRLRCRTHYGTN
jgi:hypothetical protein